MPNFAPIKRKDLIRYLRKAGFDGPYAGGKHMLMEKGSHTVRVPNKHKSDISKELLLEILKQAGIGRTEWEKM